jgi:hypothetical protein
VIKEAGRTVVAPDGSTISQSGPSDLADYCNGDAGAANGLCAALAG